MACGLGFRGKDVGFLGLGFLDLALQQGGLAEDNKRMLGGPTNKIRTLL